MELREIDISKLNPAPYNPRIEMKPGDPEWEKLAKSLREFDYIQPIVWNERTGNVVGGHQRLAVLAHDGYQTVTVSVVNLDENDEKLLNIALNKIKGEWDFEKLADILKDFDNEVASVTGFAAEEIAVILASDDDIDTEDWDFGDFGEDGDNDIVGGSFVITLVFESADLANQWAETEGYFDQIREGTSTTVIRVEE